MSPAIEASACAPAESEAPAGISAQEWIRTEAAGSGVPVSTVLVFGTSDQESMRSQRLHTEWRAAVRSQLESILRLETGWDSYGAPSISPVAAEHAMQLLASATPSRRPSVVPTSNGGVQLEWHGGGIDIEVACLPSGAARLSADDSRTGRTEERWVVPGHPAIDDWMRRLGSVATR